MGFFGINCPKGTPTPNNGQRLLPVGCRGYVTATPKDANDRDVPASVHGPDIDWALAEGHGLVDVLKPTFPSDFNKDVLAKRPGTFRLCATVQGVTGCLKADVTP